MKVVSVVGEFTDDGGVRSSGSNPGDGPELAVLCELIDEVKSSMGGANCS
jgi:hypothetical protein